MKLWKKGLACLLTAALTLAMLTGCNGLGMIGTVQKDTDAAKELMQQIDPASWNMQRSVWPTGWWKNR